MERREWLLLLSTFATIVMIGIPQSAGFYPAHIQSLVSWISTIIPSNLLVWIERVLIAFFGVFTGWFLKSVLSDDKLDFSRDTEDTDEVESRTVDGCIESDGVLWSGEAVVEENDFQNAGRMEPYCPECKTGVTKSSLANLQNVDEVDRSIRNSMSSNQLAYTSFWDCPACEFHTIRTGSESFENAMTIFQSNLEVLATPNQELYIESIYDKLVEELDREPNSKEIWMRYVSKSDAKNLSTDCFHNELNSSYD